MTGTIEASGDVKAAGDVEASGDLRVAGDLQVSGDMTVAGDVVLTGRGRGVIVTSPNGRQTRRLRLNNKGKMRSSRI